MSNSDYDRRFDNDYEAAAARGAQQHDPTLQHALLGPGGLSAMAQSQELLGLQMKSEGGGGEAGDIHGIAAQGVAGSGGPLPHGDRIQAAFGRHDVSDARAHVGGAAEQAAMLMNAQAYATGREIAFAQQPDLHTAAHEAAHVVQQRGGVSLKGGVGQAGDAHELHADTVADAVVAGRSAEGLLDEYAGAGHQAKAVQHRTDDAPKAEPAPESKLPEGLAEANIEAAKKAAKAAKYDPDAISQLQGALGITTSGEYDRQTVVAMYQKQVEWKRAKRRGVTKGFASKLAFRRLGLIAYAAQEAGEVQDAELEKLKDPAGPHAQGLTVAIATFYKKQSVNNQEIWKQADSFASSYQAASVTGGKLVTGKAVHITEVAEVVEAIRAVHATVSAKAGTEEGKEAPPWTRIRNVALFAHGMHYGMSMDEGNSYSRGIHSNDARNAPSNVEAFAAAIKNAVHGDVDVQLFACNTGRDVEYLDGQRDKRTKQAKGKKKPGWHAKVKAQLASKGRSTTDAAIGRQKGTDDSTYREWTQHDGSRTGEGSFADEMAEALGPDATVYGHSTAGHTHANYAAKMFGKGAGEGEGGVHMFDVLYPASFITAEAERLAPGLPEAAKAKAAGLVRDEMWDHYRDSISAEHKRKAKDKVYDEPVGRGMFMDPDKTRGEVQKNWTSDWLESDGKDLKPALEALRGKPGAQ